MTEPSEQELLDLVPTQRWFGAKERDVLGAAVVDRVPLGGDAGLEELLVELRYAAGGHDFYQLVRCGEGPLAERELLSVPAAAVELVRLLSTGGTREGGAGEIELCPYGAGPEEVRSAIALGAEQSNSSLVLDDRVIVKLYRHLEAGVNPELELLRFFAEHGFENVPELRGWWSYHGQAMSATLGIAQRFVPGAVDGWTLTLRELPDRLPELLEQLAELGDVVGRMHAVLASDPEDPAFAPEEASPESLALLRATVDDEIEQVFGDLPEDEVVAPIAGCGDAVRHLLGELATVGSVGKVIRHHGDLHLGQALRAEGKWLIVDFEGEPARSLPERRAKRPALRDVAGMLRSFAYAARVAGCGDDDTEHRLRQAFLEAYLSAAEPAGILPPSHQAERLIEIFELEKAVYELRYELSHRPDWVHIPVAGIESLLAQASA